MSSAIPLVQTTDRTVNQLQQNIKQAVEPLLTNPVNNGVLLTNISLSSGTNTIQHGLGRTMQGWMVADVTSAATIYRSAQFSSTTLTLTSSAATTVNLYIF